MHERAPAAAPRVTARGVELPKTPEWAALVRRELLVAPVAFNDPYPKKFRVFLETPTTFVVPLHWALAKGADPAEARPPPEKRPLRFSGTLRADLAQPAAARAVIETWNANRGGALLCLAPGYGKTVLALYLAGVLGVKTLVLVHKTFLKEQWAERAAQYLPGARVTYVQGDVCDTSGDVIIAMIQTLVSRRYPPSTFQSVGFMIFDEAQHAAAEAFSQSLWGLCTRHVLGLSATPDRKDGLTRILHWFLGPTAMRVKRENQAHTTVRMVTYDCPAFLAPPPTNRRGDICFVSVVTALVEDARRTEVIARHAAALARDHHVLVLSHRRRHVFEVAEAARRLGAECGTYVGGDKACPDTRVVVATYALTSEGFDVPRLTALVLATPASDVEQSCGRIMRGAAAGSGSAAPVIVDVVDRWGVCFAQYAKRKAFYHKSGFRVQGAGAPPPEEAAPPPTRFSFVDEEEL